MDRIYLDYSATTPVSEEVFAVIKPYFTDMFGNADSLHSFGAEGSFAVDLARRKVAKLIKAKSSSEIYFTSSGTEANNMALCGIAKTQATADKKNIIISGIEHASVRDTAKSLAQQGFSVTVLNPKSNGIIDPSDLENAITSDTFLVSVMLANNEIGTIQPIKQLCAVAKKHGLFFHCDGVAGAGYIDIDVCDLGIDSLSISAHKFYGCKGVGALYVKKDTKIKPLIVGGHAERKMRGGTSFVAGIVSLSSALEIATNNLQKNIADLKQKRDYLKQQIMQKIPDVIYNGDENCRLAQNANFTFCSVGAGELVHLLDMHGIAVSTGAACSSGSVEPSHVLMAIGMNKQDANSSIRITVGLETTISQLDFTVQTLVKTVEKLRNIQRVMGTVTVTQS